MEPISAVARPAAVMAPSLVSFCNSFRLRSDQTLRFQNSMGPLAGTSPASCQTESASEDRLGSGDW